MTSLDDDGPSQQPAGRRVTLTDEQTIAADRIREFINDGDNPVFILHGLAGTGKTTILSFIAREYPGAILCTLTGKAASILRAKTRLPACTIHSAFYQLIEATRDSKGRRDLRFEPIHDDGQLRNQIVLLDECSMVGSDLASDILHTGARIVACGDPGQLPPVKGTPFFHTPDFELKEIHRQALDSPIIRQAHAVRRGERYCSDGDRFRIARQASDADILGVDTILCWTNKTREAANREARRLRGFWQPFPQVGEPVMCLRNAPDFGIFNGATYTLSTPFIEGDTTIKIIVEDQEIKIPFVTFEGVASALPDEVEPTTSFAFGYAMTVHKAQGSEWLSVLLMDEYRRAEQRKEWLYTGITRAAERILIISA